MSVHKKCQPNRFSRLAGYMEHIYECHVLFYRLYKLEKPHYQFRWLSSSIWGLLTKSNKLSNNIKTKDTLKETIPSLDLKKLEVLKV